MTKFTTLVPHIGDRPHDPYQVGETREVDDEASVRHLVEGGTLGDFDAAADAAFKAKSESAPENKSEGTAPANKGSAISTKSTPAA